MNIQISITLVAMVILKSAAYASQFSHLNENTALNDSASICFSVGLTASLTQLDNFTLHPLDSDGSPGSIYQGQDQFHLEANGPISINTSHSPMINTDQSSTLYPNFYIDDTANFSTPNDSTHFSHHTLSSTVTLTNISAQQSGEYSSQVTLTVLPIIGGDAGCGQSTASYPSTSQWATIAFEDLYPSPGDADYNDMVVRFNVQENYNAYNQLEKINMRFIPLARGAGYNHSLKINLDGSIQNSQNISSITTPIFNGGAQVKATYFNLENSTSHSRYFRPNKDIKIFNNTRASLQGFANVYQGVSFTAPKRATDIEILINNPELNYVSPFQEIDINRYRIYLDVHNTNKDIDIAEVNPLDGMIDSNGYPFGIRVPDNWAWPLERKNINDVYPHFDDYRSWLNGDTPTLSSEAKYWYTAPVSNTDNNLINIDEFNQFIDDLNLD